MNKLLILIIAGLALGACSVKRTAVNIIGDAILRRGRRLGTAPSMKVAL